METCTPVRRPLQYFLQPFMECIRVDKEGPCLGKPTAWTLSSSQRASVMLFQEAQVYFIIDDKAERICPLELSSILVLSLRGQ